MKEKILAAIKAKFPTVKLSPKRLDAIAATIEAKAGTDEAAIDTNLDAFNEFYPLADLAKDDNERDSLKGRLKTARTSAKPSDDTTDDTGTPKDETQELLKTLIGEIAALKGEKISDSLKAKAMEQIKDIPKSYWRELPAFTKEEDIEPYVTKLTADYGAFKKEMTEAGLSVMGTPRAAGSSTHTTQPVNQALKAKLEQEKADRAQQTTPTPKSNYINTPATTL